MKAFVCIVAVVSAALLGGCVSASKVIPISNGVYVIKGRAYGPFNSDKERLKGLNKARDYCAKQSKRLLLHDIDETGHVALLGEHATITFECES